MWLREGSGAGNVCDALLSLLSLEDRSRVPIHWEGSYPCTGFPGCRALTGSPIWRAGLPGQGDARPPLTLVQTAAGLPLSVLWAGTLGPRGCSL